LPHSFKITTEQVHPDQLALMADRATGVINCTQTGLAIADSAPCWRYLPSRAHIDISLYLQLFFVIL
jgi:hypothetical protein